MNFTSRNVQLQRLAPRVASVCSGEVKERLHRSALQRLSGLTKALALFLVGMNKFIPFFVGVIEMIQGIDADGLTEDMKLLTFIGSLKFIVILTSPIFLFLFFVSRFFVLTALRMGME